jgi:hypothetical protein
MVKAPDTGAAVRDGFTVYKGGGDDRIDVDVRWHDECAVYRDDLDLTLQWGMSAVTAQAERRFEWAQGFIGTEIRSFLLDVSGAASSSTGTSWPGSTEGTA